MRLFNRTGVHRTAWCIAALLFAGCARQVDPPRALLAAPDTIGCAHGTPNPDAVRRILDSIVGFDKGPMWLTENPGPRQWPTGPSGRGTIATWRTLEFMAAENIGMSRRNGPLLFSAVLFPNDPARHSGERTFPPKIYIRFAGYRLREGYRLGHIWQGFTVTDHEQICVVTGASNFLDTWR